MISQKLNVFIFLDYEKDTYYSSTPVSCDISYLSYINYTYISCVPCATYVLTVWYYVPEPNHTCIHYAEWGMGKYHFISC